MLQWFLYSLNVQSLLIGLVVILFVFKLKQKLKYNLPPGPFALPVVGNYQLFKKQDFQQKWHEYRQKYGPVFQIKLGFHRMVFLNDINVVTEALVKKKADFANRPNQPSLFVLSEGGKNIAFANYTPTWKLHRKIAGKAIRQYMAGPLFEDMLHGTVKKVLNRMAEQKGAVDPEPYINFLMYNILNGVCFGESQEMDNPTYKRFMELDKSLNDDFAKGFVEDSFPIIAKIWKTKHFKDFLKDSEELTSIVRKKFLEHKRTFNPDNIRDLADTVILARKEAEDEENADIVSKLTDTHMLQTLMDVLFAGIDTSRFTLNFAVRYMASFPDIQTKCQEEIDKNIDRDRLPGMEDRENLGYCEATLHESMRLATIAPIGVPHATLCDTSVGGFDIPKDTIVVINHWELHHDADFWPDVDKFDPTRYLEETGKMGRKPESWLPFSAGRRVCLGEVVAKPELHLLFAAILQRFRISLAEDVSPDVKMRKDFGLVIPEDYKIILTERK